MQQRIYGRQPAQPGSPNDPVPPPPGESAGGWEQFPQGLEGYDEQSAGWEQEDVMQDPWGNQGGDDSGWFGGGGGGGGGDWGDWGQ